MRDDLWTGEQIMLCHSMYRSGHTHAEIAEAVGRSKHAVNDYITKAREKDPRLWRVIRHKDKSTQPCPDCYFGSGARDPETHWKCPFVDHFGRVEGWKAVRVEYYVNNGKNGAPARMEYTYDIKECPRFIKD